MSSIVNTYPGRFDPVYLTKLASHLKNIEFLKQTALHEEKTIAGDKYNRCISIDFCGLSAATLLFPTLDHPDADEYMKKRRNVAKAFKALCTKESLKELNSEQINGNGEKVRYFLKIRFCFSYLYSDFPICLMKAEQKDVWKDQVDDPVVFFINPPLDEDEYNLATLKKSQESSLSELMRILKDNEDLIILGGKEKQKNTIQLRFSVIPSPLCSLIINDHTAYCEPYLYDKVRENEQLSLVYPVTVFGNYSNEAGTKKRQNTKAFTGIRNHFNYLWRHDLTLFCKDATGFKNGHLKGLTKILEPDEVVGPDGTNWRHKENRIREKIASIAEKNKTVPVYDEERIKKWRSNLNDKFSKCTRKVIKADSVEESRKGISDVDISGKKIVAPFITISVLDGDFYLHIKFVSSNKEFKYHQYKSNLFFCLMAHYCYAKVSVGKKLTPVMDKTVKNWGNIQQQSTRIIKTYTHESSAHDNGLFAEIFDWNKKELKVPPENIKFNLDQLEHIGKATYPVNRKNITEQEYPFTNVSCMNFDFFGNKEL